MNPFNAPIENLRNKFVLGAQNRLRRIRDTIRKLLDDPGDRSALQAAMRHFHGLSGAAATYGFPAVAVRAGDLERACNTHLNRGTVPTAREIEGWRGIVRTLRREFGMASSGIVLRAEQPEQETARFKVLLLQSYSARRDQLVKVMGAQRMLVHVASDRATARRAIRHDLPDALIIDLAAQGGTCLSVLDSLREREGGANTGVLLINSTRAPIDKVRAVRHGADLLLDADTLPEAVADRVRALLARERKRATRILCLEPDPDQGAFLERLLRAAGHAVTLCADPTAAEAILESALPDLVLMEVVLPGTDGHELSRMLRDDPRYAHLPIILTTTREHLPASADELTTRGDDFLVKPIEPRVLLSTVAGRLERARLEARVAERDGVTGLYNHSTFVRRLEGWMRSSERHRRPSCLLLLDIDHLGELNRRFGHHVGDQVLRDLTELVRQRVRSSHLCARYGSDEFAILTHELNLDDCVRLAEALRDEFASATRFTPDGHTFKVGLSAGIAPLHPAWRQPRIWLSELEAALATAAAIGPGGVAVAERS